MSNIVFETPVQNGSSAEFHTLQPYVIGSLSVWINGFKVISANDDGWTESANQQVFVMKETPKNGDVLRVSYLIETNLIGVPLFIKDVTDVNYSVATVNPNTSAGYVEVRANDVTSVVSGNATGLYRFKNNAPSIEKTDVTENTSWSTATGCTLMLRNNSNDTDISVAPEDLTIFFDGTQLTIRNLASLIGNIHPDNIGDPTPNKVSLNQFWVDRVGYTYLQGQNTGDGLGYVNTADFATAVSNGRV